MKDIFNPSAKGENICRQKSAYLVLEAIQKTGATFKGKRLIVPSGNKLFS